MKLAECHSRKVIVLLLVLLAAGCRSSGGSDSGAAQRPADLPVANTPPTIAGTPDAAVAVGESFEFQPNAGDADGDSLSYSIKNLPGWAGFDTATGRFAGTPPIGSEGTYVNIEISVSDGSDSASLRFDVTVNATGGGTITLSWTPPTQNEDGSALTDLAGYKIYYGRGPGEYANEIEIDNASINTYVIDNLTQARYYLAATALNSAGGESNFAGEVSAIAD